MSLTTDSLQQLNVQDCIEAFNRGSPVCGSSLELLRTTVATLISISGAHRSRIHHQYQTYRTLAHDLRARLYARSGTNSHSSSHRGSMHMQRGAGAGAGGRSFRASGNTPPNRASLTLSSPGGTTHGATMAAAAATVAAGSTNSVGVDGGGPGFGEKFWRMISGPLSSSFGRGSATERSELQQRVTLGQSGALPGDSEGAFH